MANATLPSAAEGVVIHAPVEPGQAWVLSPEALRFLAELARRF